MNEVQISGDLNKSIDWLQENGKTYFQRALYRGANVLKNQTRENLSSALPASGNPNPKYDDTLQDAIRNSHTEGDVITVHILGTRASGSGTYRTRFFENGTKDRYQKTYKGVPLKKKRFIGRLKPLRFFSSAIASSESKVINAMSDVINTMMDDANKNT